MKPTQDQPPTADDPRVVRAAQEYLAELEAGRRPNRKSFVARFPEIAAELAPYLDALDMVHSAVPLLQEPEIIHGSTSAHEPPPAEPLGDFRIVREIGRGGMGVVYEAIQMSLGRRVALKVLPFAATLDPRQRQRFQHEAEAAAGLHHGNIVPVYAVGCERGLHYYAMQLIEGRPLDAVIRELRSEAGRGKVDSVAETHDLRGGPTVGRSSPSSPAPRTVGTRERFRNAARIAAQVADALEYAHGAGVIHRDIKPANLLLDAKGNVWVTDFGLAQVSADVGLTRTGDLLGTIRYMGPEQAAGRNFLVDQRSDVYSLGATLYELITLEPMFPGQDREAVLHQVLYEDPIPPRRVDRSIPIELETIVLKALSKSPTDRYATAGGLAVDLNRFLEERPILARRPSLVDRSRKWMRRHPTIVGAGLLFVTFGFIGFAVSTILIAKEEDRTKKALNSLHIEQNNTKSAWASEQERATQAEQSFKLAKSSVDEMIRIANEAGNDNPAEQNLRRRMLETALDYYKEFINQRRDDPNAQAELQHTRDQVKTILDELELLQKSWQHLLLGEPSVLEDLKLSKEQRERVAMIVKEIGGPPDQPRDPHRPKPGAGPKGKTLVNEIKAHETAIHEILSASQLSRLRQIALQVRGAIAFHEPEVVAALELTPEQKEQIRMIEGEGPPGGRGPRPGGPPHPANSSRRDREPPRRPIERVLAILTDKQKEQWKALIGPPFKGTISFFEPPGMGGPGGFEEPDDGPGGFGGGRGGAGGPGGGPGRGGGPGDPGRGGDGGRGGRGGPGGPDHDENQPDA